MRKRSFVPLVIAILFAILADTAPASAQLWVATGGTGNANCTRAQPCRLFSQALVANGPIDGREINCVDSGDFIDDITITKSVTFDCSDVHASISTANFSFGVIKINAPAGKVVVLKGLDLDHLTASTPGPNPGAINFTGGGFLHIENVKINNWLGEGTGIYFAPTSGGRLHVSNTTITNIGDSGLGSGIYIKPASSSADVTIENCRLSHNKFGIVADGSLGVIRGTVTNSVVSHSVNNGITATGGSSVFLLVKDTAVGNNTYGLVAGGGSGMLVSRTVVVGNTTGLFTTSGGVLYSYGNNEVNGNTTTDGAFSGSIPLK